MNTKPKKLQTRTTLTASIPLSAFGESAQVFPAAWILGLDVLDSWRGRLLEIGVIMTSGVLTLDSERNKPPASRIRLLFERDPSTWPSIRESHAPGSFGEGVPMLANIRTCGLILEKLELFLKSRFSIQKPALDFASPFAPQIFQAFKAQLISSNVWSDTLAQKKAPR